MHATSYERMKRFAEEFADRIPEDARILEVGSAIIGNSISYRMLFEDWQRLYVGLDLELQPGVDVVAEEPYRWRELKPNYFDLVISGQALEHIEYPWETMLEIGRVIKRGGLVCIIAPSRGREHKHPLDCYRFLPDGMRALAKYADLKVLQCDMDTDPAATWGDCCLVAEAP